MRISSVANIDADKPLLILNLIKSRLVQRGDNRLINSVSGGGEFEIIGGASSFFPSFSIMATKVLRKVIATKAAPAAIGPYR